MLSLWDDKEAAQYRTELELRVYTSRLLGRDKTLVLHGGGNTSVKVVKKNLFGEDGSVSFTERTILPGGDIGATVSLRFNLDRS